MKKGRYSEEQIIGVLKRMEAGQTVKDLARELGVSGATLYTWKSKYGGLDVNEVRRMKELEDENHRLKHMVADLSLDKEALKVVIGKTAGAVGRRQDVAFVMAEYSYNERRACKRMGMDRTNYRYQPRRTTTRPSGRNCLPWPGSGHVMGNGASRCHCKNVGSPPVHSGSIESIARSTWQCGGSSGNGLGLRQRRTRNGPSTPTWMY